jgi:hypothetical protein
LSDGSDKLQGTAAMLARITTMHDGLTVLNVRAFGPRVTHAMP